MTDLVVISLEDWDEVWRRNQHLVAGLIRSRAVRRVLFVEPAVDALHEIRRRRRPASGGTGLRQIRISDIGSAELWALRPRKSLPRKVDPGGDQRRARHIAAVARKLEMKTPVLWVNDPGGAQVMAITGWQTLYDITDDWLVADRPQSELERLRRQESALFAGCSEIVVCSPSLALTKSERRDVTLIPNAVDLEPYRTLQPRPADLPVGPVALYLGTVHRDRVDVELCAATAQRLARDGCGTLVLVGPAPLSRDDFDVLTRAGVRVLGPRPGRSVPSYLQHSDVLLVPHVLTAFTASLDPIKAYEYRAARRPVVSTPVPGFIDSADPLVTTVEPQGFAEAAAAGAATHVPWSGDLPSDIPSWTQRVRQMAGVVARVEGA